MAVLPGEFFRSIPAFAVRIPFLIVSRNPGTPPRKTSASSNTRAASLLSICHFLAIRRAYLDTLVSSRLMIRRSAVETTLLAIAMISPSARASLFFLSAWTRTLSRLSPSWTVGNLTGRRNVALFVTLLAKYDQRSVSGRVKSHCALTSYVLLGARFLLTYNPARLGFRTVS